MGIIIINFFLFGKLFVVFDEKISFGCLTNEKFCLKIIFSNGVTDLPR